MKIVCIGDSLTTGFGVFKEKRWTDILKESNKLNIINKGINGDTTTGMLLRFYEDVIALKPTHVNIMAGCNDLLSHRPLKNIIDNMKEMVVDAQNSGIIPLLCTEIPVIKDMAERKWSSDADYNYAIENSLNYRDWILEFTTEKNILCIDLYKLFMDSLNTASTRELYIDGLHPSEKGHRIIAEEFAKIFLHFS